MGGGGAEVTLITGAASGIGRAVAIELAGQGTGMAIVDTNGAGLDETVAQLGAADTALPLIADITQTSEVTKVFDEVESTLGPVTTVVNAAGALVTGPVEECTDEEWDRALSVNATGVFVVSRAAGRRMADRGRGSLVTVASNAAGVPRADMAAYAASKAAAVAFTKSLGLELAPKGVRCNIVSPGSTDTPMLRSMSPDTDLASVVAGRPERFRVGIPLGRVAHPRDVAAAVRFLVSDEARHITMHELYVDGGATLR